MSAELPGERRTAARVRFEKTVEVHVECRPRSLGALSTSTRPACAARALDLSASGMSLSDFPDDTQVDRGDELVCVLPANTRPIEVTAEVAWVCPGNTPEQRSIGVIFREITRSGELRLLRLIDELVPQPAYQAQTTFSREIVLDPEVFTEQLFDDVETEQQRREVRRRQLYDRLWWAIVVLAAAMTIAAVLVLMLR